MSTNHGGKRAGAGRPPKGRYGEKTKPVRIPLSMLDEVESLLQGRGNNFKIPLFAASVPAGHLVNLENHVDEYFDLNSMVLNDGSNRYLIKVSGDSMIGANICEGDILVVDRSREPKHKDIVIAAINQEVTVKRLFKSDGHIMLMPENNRYDPIIVPQGEEFEIYGVVDFVIHKAN